MMYRIFIVWISLNLFQGSLSQELLINSFKYSASDIAALENHILDISKSEKSISDDRDLNPNINDLGFDINSTKDTIYRIKAFVTFNNGLIIIQQLRVLI